MQVSEDLQFALQLEQALRLSMEEPFWEDYSHLLNEPESSSAPASEPMPESKHCENDQSFQNDEDQESDTITCPVCLYDVGLMQQAKTPCGHHFCVSCVLDWAEMHSPHTCPLCKEPFSELFTRLKLDGSPCSDADIGDWTRESIGLLLRACWRSTTLTPKHKRLSASDEFAADVFESQRTPTRYGADDWGAYDEDDDWDYEWGPERDFRGNSTFRCMPGGGRMRGSQRSFGNRRWGSNGIVQQGHMVATPSPQTPQNSKGKGKALKTPLQDFSKAGGCSSSSSTPYSSSSSVPMSASAKKNAKRKGKGKARDTLVLVDAPNCNAPNCNASPQCEAE
jgi:hypothetical protein